VKTSDFTIWPTETPQRVGGLLRGPRVDLELDHAPVEAVLGDGRLHLLDRRLHRA